MNVASIQQRQIESFVKNNNICNKYKYLLSFRFNDEDRQEFIYKHIKEHSKLLEDVSEYKLNYLGEEFIMSPSDTNLLQEIKEVYLSIKNIKSKYSYFYNQYFSYETPAFPYEIAKTIMVDCKNYPRAIASIAEKSCRLNANVLRKPVGQIAINENWFE